MRFFDQSALPYTQGLGEQAMEGLGRKPGLGHSSALTLALDSYFNRLERVPCVSIVDELIRSLAHFHDIAAASASLAEFRVQCQNHPLHALVLQDPFTERAFTKPRGYAGDAVMLDYIYRPVRLSLTDIGEAFHFATTGISTARSIAWRRDRFGAQIGKTIRRKRNAQILSVANGNLRELDRLKKLTDTRDVGIVALDQDEASLRDAVNSYPEFNIRPVKGSISHLFMERDVAKYDLIYSASLFDDLSAGTASSVLKRLIRMLRPDGKLLLGNYAPENYGRGYMEGMMDWTPVCRGESDLKRLVAILSEGCGYRTYRDSPGNIVYLEVFSRN
jgi:extracellular factor (EF) 3-hydroxypalmitic acid methyl ester biosynthesis protein